MKKILFFCILFIGLNWLAVHGHYAHPLPKTEVSTQKQDLPSNSSVLGSVKVTLDPVHNRIWFHTPYVIRDVDITIKLYGNQVILQQRGMTIQDGYSITFPTRAKDGKYTVLLQQDNQIMVKHLHTSS